MVMKGPLDLNFVLGHDYIYGIKVVMSTLFRVMHFPHDKNIVTINQISFTNNCTTFAHPISLSDTNVQEISPPP